MRIAIDLDGTICPIKPEGMTYADLEPLPGAVERIRQLKEQGHTVIILTARHMKTCNGDVGKVIARVGKLTLDWLDRHGIPYDEVHFGKPNADLYIDDRGLRFTGWDAVTDEAIALNARDK